MCLAIPGVWGRGFGQRQGAWSGEGAEEHRADRAAAMPALQTGIESSPEHGRRGANGFPRPGEPPLWTL